MKTDYPYGGGSIVKITEDNPLGSPGNPITYGHFLAYDKCPYGFYLNYLDPDTDTSQLPIKGITAQNIFIQRRIKGLFKRDNSIRFTSPSTFASSAAWSWIRFYLAAGSEATIDNSSIVWRNFDEIERSIETITQATFNYYKLLESSGYPHTPIPGQQLPLVLYDFPDKKTNYREHNLQFSFNDKKNYLVKIDEIWRVGTLVTNSLARTPPTRKNLETDVIYTLQALAYCIKAKDIPSYRMAWGLDDSFPKKLKDKHIAEELNIVHNHLFTGEQYTIHRSDESLGALEDKVSGLEKKISGGMEAFPANHKSCYVCRFNTKTPTGGIVCSRANLKNGPIDYSLKKGAVYGIKLKDTGLKMSDKISEILAGLGGEFLTDVGIETLTESGEPPVQPELFS